MSYCETTAFELMRRTLATPPSTCGTGDAVVVVPVVIGRLRRALSESTWYCGACITIGYCTPFFGFSQNVGATWLLPASTTNRLFVTSRSVSPTYCERARSTSMLKPGLLCDCWMRAS